MCVSLSHSFSSQYVFTSLVDTIALFILREADAYHQTPALKDTLNHQTLLSFITRHQLTLAVHL